jgi:hypothetical protein
MDGYSPSHANKSNLVGGFNPSEKYDDIPNMMGKMKLMFQTTYQ